MSNLLFSANVVVPLMAVMLIGYVARYLKIINDTTVSECNTLAFKVFLPILLFNNARNASSGALSDVNIFIFIALCIVIAFAVATFIILYIEKDNRKRGVMIQGICRSNYALFGVPLVTLLLPDSDLALVSVLIALVIPMYNILSVIVLTYFGTKNFDVPSMVLALVKNPLIIATTAGILLMLFKVKLPDMIDTTLLNIGDIASPFALFMLGARFDFSQLKRIGKQLWIVCAGRLLIIPIIVMPIAIVLGYRSVELAAIMAIFCAPTAASSYVMAEKMGGDGDLASAIVVFTSLLSIFSMFVTIYLLNSQAYF